MQQRWTLNVKGFGKIERASVRVAPLTLLIGENNSGKSYLVSLLWGVLARGRTLFPKEPPATETYRKCVQHLDGTDGEVSREFEDALVEWFNQLLKSRRNELVQDIFAQSALSIEHLSISDFYRTKRLSVQWDHQREDVSARFSARKHHVRFPVPVSAPLSDVDKYRMLQYLCWNLIMGDLSSPLFTPGSSRNRRLEGETLYLPAARSGFMLTYKSLTAELMNAWSGDEVSSTFTLPVVRFLQGLTENTPFTKAKLADVADYIEHGMMDGQVKTTRGAINSYSYQPQGSRRSLPYHVASSLVGELSPIVIFLRSNIKYKSLIIEEPEAHLHPGIQRRLTCALSRIVSAQVPVWCTTHSDTIFQQVNNLMRLSQRADRAELMKQYGYAEGDLLHPDDVTAYEFRVQENGKSVVEPLDKTEYGFVAPTFNDALTELSNETLALME